MNNVQDYEYPLLTKHIDLLFEKYGIKDALRDEFVFRSREFGQIAIVSDYREADRLTDYSTYVMLCTTKGFLKVWHEEILKLRNKRRLGIREMAYKKLNDKLRVRALPEWLDLANKLSGHLIVVTIDKKLDTVFGESLYDLNKYMADRGFTQWKKADIKEKALRITHLISYISSLCTDEDEELYWITDQDPIVDNDEQRQALERLLMHVMPFYFSHNLDKFKILVPLKQLFESRPDIELFIKDVLSIPDLVCGAVSAALTAIRRNSRDLMKESDMEIYKFLQDRNGELDKHLINLPAESLESRIGLGGQLFEIVYNKPATITPPNWQGKTFSQEDKLKHLIEAKWVQVQTLYQQAVKKVKEPVIFILDLGSKFCKNLAVKVAGQSRVDKHLRYCKYQRKVPILIIAIPREVVEKFDNIYGYDVKSFLKYEVPAKNFRIPLIAISSNDALFTFLPEDI